MSDRTEFYMAEIHRLTLETRRAENRATSADRQLMSHKMLLDNLLIEHHKLLDNIDEIKSVHMAEKVQCLEDEIELLRSIIQEQQFYVAQRKACKSCEEHVDYAPNLQDMASYFAGLLEVEGEITNA